MGNLMTVRLDAAHTQELDQNGVVFLPGIATDSDWLSGLTGLGAIMPSQD